MALRRLFALTIILHQDGCTCQALLHYAIGERANAPPNCRSDRLDEFGEYGGDSWQSWGFGRDCVVAAAASVSGGASRCTPGRW